MHRLKFLMAVLFTALLIQAAPARALGLPGSGATTPDPPPDEKGNNHEEPRKGWRPGSNTTFSWTNQDPKACFEAKRPVLVYIYDDALTNQNHTAWFFEKQLFADAKVQKSLKDFLFVMAPRTKAPWSEFFLAKAEGGAAVFLLTYDGTVHGSWMKGMRPMPEDFAAVAMTVTKTNPYIIERAKMDVVTEIDYSKLRQTGPRQEDPAARKEVVGRLSDGIAGWLKAGETPKVWLTVLSKNKEEFPVTAATPKALTISVKNNPMLLPWEKMNGEDLLSVAKSVAGEKPDRQLLAAEVALAVGYVNQALDLLSSAQQGSPELKAKALAIAAKINPNGGTPAPAPAPTEKTTPAIQGDKAP